VIVTARHDERRADVEVHWEGGARTELSFALKVHGKLEQDRLEEDTLELIRRLAEHHSDRQIAGFLSRQGARTGTGLPFTESRVRGVRRRAGIPAAPPPDPTSQVLSIQRAADQLGVSDQTIRRWINTGLLPAQQTTPGAPWRIRLTDDIRARFVPEIPDGYVPLDQAARRLACSPPDRAQQGPTRRARSDPSHQRPAKRPQNQGSRPAAGPTNQPVTQEVQCEPTS
jgi:excisionase family DNA binding protein